MSGQSNSSVSVSYWQSSLRCFQLPSRAIPGCLQGSRPWASTSAFYSRITQPSLQVFSSFLCMARFSLLSAWIAKTPQWGWRKMPELKHEPSGCFYMLFKWPRPDKKPFPYGGKEKGCCSQEPATSSQGASCQEEKMVFCLPVSLPELSLADCV